MLVITDPTNWLEGLGTSIESVSIAHVLQGRFHYLGGRFVPPSITEKYNLQLPTYPGSSMCVKLNSSFAKVRFDGSVPYCLSSPLF